MLNAYHVWIAARRGYERRAVTECPMNTIAGVAPTYGTLRYVTDAEPGRTNHRQNTRGEYGAGVLSCQEMVQGYEMFKLRDVCGWGI